MSSIKLGALHLRAARLSLRAKIKTLQRHSNQKVHSFEFTMSHINVYDRRRVCAFVFVNEKRKRNLDGEFLKNFGKVFNQETFEQTMVFLVRCVTHATTELKLCAKRLQLSFGANIFRRGDILFPL